MANVKTFDLIIFFDGGYDKSYYNISRSAVKHYLDWYKESESFLGYHVDEIFDVESFT